LSSLSIAVCSSCPARGSVQGHRCAVYPSSSLTDAEWAILEVALPPPGNRGGKDGRHEKHCRRLVLDAIFYVVRGGIAWRQLPCECPPAMTVYAIFRRWSAAGTWQRVHDALRDRVRVRAGRTPQPTAAIVDSQSVQGSDTVPAASRGYDAGKKTNGRKRHIAVDSLGLLPAVVVTVASIQDRDGAIRLLAAMRAKFATVTLVWADGGYAGRLLEWAKNVLTLTVQIVKRTDDLKGFQVLPRRWIVERTYAWITKHRRCIRDYETRPDHHEAIVYIAMIFTMTPRLTRSGGS
jgi:transposase